MNIETREKIAERIAVRYFSLRLEEISFDVNEQGERCAANGIIGVTKEENAQMTEEDQYRLLMTARCYLDRIWKAHRTGTLYTDNTY